MPQSSMPASCEVYYKLRTDKIQEARLGTTLSGEDSNTVLAGKQNEGKFPLEFDPANETYDLFYRPLNENGEGPAIVFNRTIIRTTLYRSLNLLDLSFRVDDPKNIDVFRVGDPIQIGDEILVVSNVTSGNPTTLEVENRGDHGTDAVAHSQGATVVLLRYSVPHNAIKLDGFLDSGLPLRVIRFLLGSTIGPLGNGIEVEIQLPDSQVKTLRRLQLQLSTELWPEDLSNVTGLKDIKAKDNDGKVTQGGTGLTTQSSLLGFAGKYLYTHEGINLGTGEITFGRCVVIDSVTDNGDGSWTADVAGDWIFRLRSGAEGSPGTINWIVADAWLTPGNTPTWVADKLSEVSSSTGFPGDPAALNTHRTTIITGSNVFGRCRLTNWQGVGPWTYWDGVGGSADRADAVLFEPGKIQAGALDGTLAGFDGVGLEFVFQRTATNTAPAAIVTPEAQLLLPDYVPADWFDNPPAATLAKPFLWAAVRIGTMNSWSEFGAPLLWETGGTDGAGVEFVFRRTATSTAPSAIVTTSKQRKQDDFIPADWSDSPPGASPTTQFLWASKRTGSTMNWEEFSVPTVWTVPGQDGAGTEFIYSRTATNVVPGNPTTTLAQRKIDDHVPTGWTDDPVGPDETNPFEWVSARNGSTKNWGEFSAPAQWANYAVGVDGPGFEFVFRLTATSASPAAPTPGVGDSAQNVQRDDYIPPGWADNATGVSTAMPFEWCSRRKKLAGVWGAFGTPFVFGKEGPPGATISTGVVAVGGSPSINGKTIGDAFYAADGRWWSWDGTTWNYEGDLTGPEGATITTGNIAEGASPTTTGVSIGDVFLAADGRWWTWSGTAWVYEGDLTGPQGDKGNQGIKGVPGNQGEPGPKGFLGNRGIKGEPGEQGNPGGKGPTGDRGFKGVQGLQGNIGTKGNLGGTGVKGVRGLQGITGGKGGPGGKGNRGVQGIQGVAGGPGGPGGTGVKGVQGIQGTAGTKGLEGDRVFIFYTNAPQNTNTSDLVPLIKTAEGNWTTASGYFWYASALDVPA